MTFWFFKALPCNKIRVFNFVAFFLVFFTLVSCFNPSKSLEIREIFSFSEVKEDFPQGSLFLFDIDETLISSKDILAKSNPCPFWFYFPLYFSCPELLITSKWEETLSLIQLHAKKYLIEPSVISRIKDLKEKGFIFLGLTSLETGSYGVISSFPKLRHTRLLEIGIAFSLDFGNCIFSNLPSYRKNYPELYEGILCTNHCPKGAVLASFFDFFRLKPPHVIFFDDRKSNLVSVGTICKKRKIPCSLYLYKGATRLSKDWNSHLILKQIKFLLREKRWFSDLEVEKM
ncbi:MAG: DUF2608 domain-containing protein [Chlamydiota bacterium]